MSNPPSNRPVAVQPPETEETVTISRNTLSYILIAVLFFLGGYVVAWLVFSATTGSLVGSAQAGAETAVAASVSTAIAQLPQVVAAASTSTNRAVALPVVLTPRAVPNQAINAVNAPSWGLLNARVTVIEYGDFQCPYCEAFFQQTYPQLKLRYGGLIRYEFRNFPSPAHPDAYPSALAAECANEQGKFWEYHDLLYANQGDLSADGLIHYATLINLNVPQFTDCFHSQKYADVINSDIKDAHRYQAAGTPTFFLNGQFMQGAQSYAVITSKINELLFQTGEVQLF